MSYPRSQRSRAFRSVTDTSLTTATFTTTTPTQIDASLDLTIEAQVGDIIECGLAGFWDGAAQTYSGAIDIYSVNSGIYHWTGTTSAASTGNPGWMSGRSSTGSLVGTPIAGSIMRAAVSGDLSSGQLTVRPLAYLTSAGSRTINSAGLHFWVKNLGPSDPE